MFFRAELNRGLQFFKAVKNILKKIGYFMEGGDEPLGIIGNGRKSQSVQFFELVEERILSHFDL